MSRYKAKTGGNPLGFPRIFNAVDDRPKRPIKSQFERGEYITKTQLKDPKRIERLILILTVACYWAASTGITH